jgi:2-dehydro-3-deoxyphosphogluconate aldolase / (4S)-4-hydroxy-2-oxoglutarate aldolase
MDKSEIIQRLLHPGIIAIIRADSSAHLIEATRSLLDGGIVAVEITMTTPNALQVIREAAQTFGENILLGVGSALDSDTARRAIEAGANFVVTPVFRPQVIATCRRLEKPIMSGAYTPTEAAATWEAGSDFIKIFPADGLGPNYIKAIRAPLPQLQIVPTGGIDAKNCGEFIEAGCVAVAAGSSLVSKTILEQHDWKTLTARASEFISTVKAAKDKLKSRE